MRKITQEAGHAFDHGYKMTGSNTKVYNEAGAWFLELFGHVIARKDADGLEITNCGYFTATTKERLNAIQGVHIVQKAGIWYLNGKEWGGAWIKIDCKHIQKNGPYFTGKCPICK